MEISKNINNIQVFGTIYSGNGCFGDFNWMISNPDYHSSLFIFNDNEEHHETCRQGAGNAIIRKYNKYSDLDIPRSFGIPTGSLNTGGYTLFNKETKDKIDEYFIELNDLIIKHKYNYIYYSSESNGLLGTSIFTVNRKVLEYITCKIHSLNTNKSSKSIKIIKSIKVFGKNFDSNYFDEYESESESELESDI